LKIQFDKLLSGGDLRSTGESNSVVLAVHDQNDFDKLFKCLFHKDRIVVMRAADATEKITVKHSPYLSKHKNALIELCHSAKNKELKWHLALLIPRLNLSHKEIGAARQILTDWASDKNESRIVRINSIQALYEICTKENRSIKSFENLLARIERENIPSINARIRNLNKAIIP
jgi:hypothetical protein